MTSAPAARTSFWQRPATWKPVLLLADYLVFYLAVAAFYFVITLVSGSVFRVLLPAFTQQEPGALTTVCDGRSDR